MCKSVDGVVFISAKYIFLSQRLQFLACFRSVYLFTIN